MAVHLRSSDDSNPMNDHHHRRRPDKEGSNTVRSSSIQANPKRTHPKYEGSKTRKVQAEGSSSDTQALMISSSDTVIRGVSSASELPCVLESYTLREVCQVPLNLSALASVSRNFKLALQLRQLLRGRMDGLHRCCPIPLGHHVYRSRHCPYCTERCLAYQRCHKQLANSMSQ